MLVSFIHVAFFQNIEYTDKGHRNLLMILASSAMSFVRLALRTLLHQQNVLFGMVLFALPAALPSLLPLTDSMNERQIRQREEVRLK